MCFGRIIIIINVWRTILKYVLKNVNLLDGNLDENKLMPIKKCSVAVCDDVISGIYAEGEALPEGYEVIDCENGYLMPGLINLHVHLAASGKPPKAKSKPVNYKLIFDVLTKVPFAMTVFRKLEEGLAKNHLYSGVTTIRTVGGVLDLDGKVKDRIKAGKIKGPRIITCNTAVSVPGGHFAGSLATEAKTPEDAVNDVKKIVATNPDWIKLMITGGVMDASAEGEPGVLKMSPEIVRAACDEAHKHGLKVCAHVESPEGVRVALENGVDTVEHGAKPDWRIIELFRTRESAAVCTVSPALPYVSLPEEISHCGDLGRKNGKIVVDGIIECAKKCLENGIPVGMGTDAGCNFITPYDMWRELHYFTKYVGVSPDFALHTATKINASILGIDGEVGTVEVGKKADLIVSRKNPLSDFSALKTLDYVITNGEIIKNPVIKKRKDVEEALDTLL